LRHTPAGGSVSSLRGTTSVPNYDPRTRRARNPARPGGQVHDQLERYIADTLLPPAAHVSVARQQVRRVDVHWHDFYELVHVTRGRACHRVNGVPHVLAPGATVLLTPADFHEIVPECEETLEYV